MPLSVDNRWIHLSKLIAWEEVDVDYAALFCKGSGAPATPSSMPLGALIIKARLGPSNVELVGQIKENPFLWFFVPEVFQDMAPFDPLMMFYFCKRLPESFVNDCQERIVCGTVWNWSELLKQKTMIKILAKEEVAFAMLNMSSALRRHQKDRTYCSSAPPACVHVDIRWPTNCSLLMDSKKWLRFWSIRCDKPRIIWSQTTHMLQARWTVVSRCC